jgi:hypothetical protein
MPHPARIAAASLPALLIASALGAQPRVPDNARVRQALEQVRAAEPAVIQEQIDICQIEAPPFKETRRAEDFRRRLEAMGLRNVRIDSVGNVIAERPGAPGEPVVVISGHLDTVFPEGTDVTVRREGTTLRGPGIGDDCRGLAIVLAVARTLEQSQIQTRGTVIFVGTVGEEGAGNLRGVRHLFERELAGRVDYFISVDGTGLGLTKDAVGSHRYTVTYRGPGGHSYGDFGAPNPVHALGRAIAKVAEFQVPSDPRVTFSVGIVEGGTSVNSIAMSAGMQVDMRSVDAGALDPGRHPPGAGRGERALEPGRPADDGDRHHRPAPRRHADGRRRDRPRRPGRRARAGLRRPRRGQQHRRQHPHRSRHPRGDHRRRRTWRRRALAGRVVRHRGQPPGHAVGAALRPHPRRRALKNDGFHAEQQRSRGSGCCSSASLFLRVILSLPDDKWNTSCGDDVAYDP